MPNTEHIPHGVQSRDVEMIQRLVEQLYAEKTAHKSWGESAIELKWQDGALTLVTIRDVSTHKPPSVKERERHER